MPAFGGYVKYYCQESGDTTIARVFAGQDQEAAVFSGTIVFPTELFERLLDCTLLGASQARFEGSRIEVYFGPDDPER